MNNEPKLVINHWFSRWFYKNMYKNQISSDFPQNYEERKLNKGSLTWSAINLIQNSNPIRLESKICQEISPIKIIDDEVKEREKYFESKN